MKAEEIRVEQDKVKTYGRASNFGKNTVEHMTCWVLHEIAAQLAELNFTLSTFSGLQLSLPDWCNAHNAERLFWQGFHYCPVCFPNIHKEALSEARSKCPNG